MVERGVHHALRHAFRNPCTERCGAHTAADGHHLAIRNAAHFSVMGMDVEHVFRVPCHIVRAPCLCAHIILRQDAARGENERERTVGALVGRHEFGDHEAAKTAHEATHMHEWCALRCLVIAGPLDGTQTVKLLE